MEDPGKFVESYIYNKTIEAAGVVKKGVGEIANTLLSGVATATEPFIKKNLGERYLSSAAFIGGIGLWIIATILDFYYGAFPAIYWARFNGNERAEEIFHNIQVICPLIGIGAIICFIVIGIQNKNADRKRHREGVPRHSKSRGEWRFPDPSNILKPVAIFVSYASLIVALPLGVLIFASIIAQSIMRYNQRNAFYYRYLDASDRQIEIEQLKTALLGQSPIVNTYLYEPLSIEYPPALRERIASANAVSHNQGLAQTPRLTPVSASALASTQATSTTAQALQVDMLQLVISHIKGLKQKHSEDFDKHIFAVCENADLKSSDRKQQLDDLYKEKAFAENYYDELIERETLELNATPAGTLWPPGKLVQVWEPGMPHPTTKKPSTPP